MDTDHNTSYTRDTSLDHHNPDSINHPKRKKWSTSYSEAKLQRKLQTSNFWICPSIFREKGTYTFRKSWESLTELIWSKYVYLPGSSQQLFLNKYWVSTSDSWSLLALAHTEIPIFQRLFPNTLYYGLRSISGNDSEKYPMFDSGNNTEYLQVLLNILRILFGTKRTDEKSEIREQAGSRQIPTTLQKHDNCSPASRHWFPNLWLMKMQMTKWGVNKEYS